MLTNMFCGREVFLDSKTPIFCTGNIVEVKSVDYQEFVQTLPSPDWLRHHYFPKKNSSVDKNNKIISKSNFSEAKYHPTLIGQKIERLMIDALNRHVNRKSLN